jgi:quinol monooxygenase YgiN
MWAQLIRMHLKPGKADGVTEVIEALRAAEQPGSGLIRSLAMVDQKDRSQFSFLVVFDSEESARARENDERRQAGLEQVRALMADVFDGAPEFTDFDVVSETLGS